MLRFVFVLSAFIINVSLFAANANQYSYKKIKKGYLVIGQNIGVVKYESEEMLRQNEEDVKTLDLYMRDAQSDSDALNIERKLESLINESLVELKKQAKVRAYTKMSDYCQYDLQAQANTKLESVKMECQEFRRPKLKVKCNVSAKLICLD